MSLRFHNLIETPPGGWKFFVHETSQWIQSWADYNSFKRDLIAHMRANNVPVPLDLDVIIQEQMCKNLPPDRCGETDGASEVLVPPTLETFFRGTRAIGSWLLAGGETVPEQEVQRRLQICSRCPLNESLKGCPACQMGKVANLIVSYIKNLKQYAELKSCRVCGCALNVKVYVPVREIIKQEPDRIRAAYPDHCWLNEKNIQE